MQKTKPCLNCEKTIIKPQNESLKNWETRHKYCSKSCSAIHRLPGKKTIFTKERHYVPPTAIKKGQQLSPTTQFKKGIIPWAATHRELMPPPWNKGKRFEAVTGPKHHNWKNGISKLTEKIRKLPEMQNWKMEIFKRDNYTCQKCFRFRKAGDRVEIQAHHIKQFSLILKEEKIQSVESSLKCNLLWDINNGVTLCKECHKKEDKLIKNQY